MCNEIVGVNGDEGTPVPIPNTVVKLVYGDNTWLATAREDNSTPTSFQTDPKGSVLLFLSGRKIPNGSFRMIRVCEVKTQTVGNARPRQLPAGQSDLPRCFSAQKTAICIRSCSRATVYCNHMIPLVYPVQARHTEGVLYEP